MNWDLEHDYLLDELELENLDDELEEVLFPEFDEEEYLREMQEYVEYIRSINAGFDKHCQEIEAMEVADAE